VRGLVRLSGGVGADWRRGRLLLGGRLGLRGARGWTDGESWSDLGGRIWLGGSVVGGPRLVLVGEAGRQGGQPSRWDRYRLGGQASNLHPDPGLDGRVSAAYLPLGAGEGEEFSRLRAVLGLGGVNLFGERLQAWTGSHRPDPIHAAGLEIESSMPAIPLAQLPATRLVLGVAHVFDEPLEGKWRGYLGLVYRP